VTVRIGCGAGYAGDRLEAAAELAERGALDYLVLECLAERTLALAYARKRRDPSLGYDAGLAARMETLLPTCAAGTTLVSNLGAANPRGALDATVAIARRLGLTGMLVGAVDGDDVLERLDGLDRTVWETGQPLALGDVDWAHAYLGADALLPALRAGCRVVLAGRIADPSLFLAPLMHEFGWAADDWPRLGRGTMVGHLLECGSSVTGGYFAEPGRKDVDDLTSIGMPIAEVAPDGTAVVGKTPGTGGQVSVRTCKEQLLYEIHDPAAYLTPDVTADFSRATLTQDDADRVAVGGGSGHVRPDELKVVMGVRDGFIGEGEMSYAGPGALGRARLSAEIVRDRLDRQGVRYSDLRTEFIGYDSVLGPIARRASPPEPFEVRLRIAARTETEHAAATVGAEVEALTITGPAGGAGKRSSTRAVVSVRSTSIPRGLVETTLHTATT
jgi:acyclic terpene utilization AtuA family protein